MTNRLSLLFKGIYLVSLTLLILSLPAINYCSAQTISGTINIYTKITNIASNNITVGSSAGFSVADKVLVIQMQGATLNQTNTSSCGDITSYNNAGYYEFATISAVNGNVITLQTPLCHAYDIPGAVQMVRVPVYNDVTVTGTLICTPWNGSTGGVLVMEVGGNLTLNANIDVSGNGFRGGNLIHGGFGCGNPNWILPSSQAGQKGESIAAYVANMDGARGKWAGGGGGSMPGNCGGGGGGNANVGGLGGKEYSGCGATGVQGSGGAALTYSNGRAFMGSGGGGGFSDNGQPVVAGTNGGAIILITATTLTGNNNSILSNGINQTALTRDEGAGGGGAGGCIILNVQNYVANVTVETKGGDGGSTNNTIFTGDCHGPGGGGGSGMLILSRPSMPPNITYNCNGGKAGLVLHPTSPCFNTSYGALDGVGGVATSAQFNFSLPAPLTPVNLGNDTGLCPGTPLTLDAGAGYNSYLWQDGSAAQTFNVLASGAYAVTVSNTAGCTDVDTLTVTTLTSISINIGNDTSVCVNQPVTINAGAGYSTYVWQDASANPTFFTTVPGTYSVTVTNSAGCTGTDARTVSNYPSPFIYLGRDTALCPGSAGVTLDAGPGMSTYQWQDGSTNQTFSTALSGTYFVDGHDANGCLASDTLIVLPYLPVPSGDFIKDTTMCPGIPTVLIGPPGYSFYLWDGKFKGINYPVTTLGNHYLMVRNTAGCSGTDSVNVTELCQPIVYFPNAFSPNGDKKNDLFKAFGYNITDFSLKIFNRWGQLVFATDNIDEGWDGTVNGQLCTTGTYVYMASYSGTMKDVISSGTVKGNVTLVR